MKEIVIIQGELKAPKGQFNEFGKYRYRSAEDILEAVKPLLKENDCALTLTDDIILIGNRFYVKSVATLTNLEGASISVSALAREDESKKGMDGAQITGAASSYARKYAMNGLFCIDDTKDPDATNDHGKTVKALEQVMSEAYKITDANEARAMCKAPEYKAYHQELINYFKEKFHETK